MPKLISSPSIIEAAGTKPKKIEEFAGRISNHSQSGTQFAAAHAFLELLLPRDVYPLVVGRDNMDGFDAKAGE